MAYQIGDNCVACGLCVEACPVNCISEGTPYTIDADACVACGLCAEACPVQAITE
ncbi:MAG: 4Fe-4S binding protein [Methanosphaera sp.]|uniref:4Fe-4S binding protein n=1 Tax=Methanosphaera sp. TaxID=2666342 RepID=UPI0025F68544|nr:4Fe-4S binding protein [Methanosphaera sp.]MCI5867622.1 4Fe-4S binding protein [Methanosphaera sp.]MDD6534089.1 4Fe-4S binding protein [Methanosphaera sp.]MDY3956101.1 4Fe-4S binding protein [Methanosphaera sp.]